MARSNYCIRAVLLLAFAAILVFGEKKTRHNLTKELGLTLQTVNETVTSLSTDFQKMKSTMDNTSALQEEALKKMADRQRLLEESVKTNALEFQKMEEKLTQHHYTKMEEIQDHLTKLEEKLDNDTKRQDLLLDIIKSFQVLLHVPQNCADLLKQGDTESGVRTVYPFSCSMCRPVSVLCDQTNNGGGWTVVQRRDALPKREDFFRNWEDYRRGFGDIEGEFWLGLDNIHALVSGTPMELRVDLEDFDGQKRWAQYDAFFIEDAADKYRLNLGHFSGDAGDSLTYHSGQRFRTKDQDNDNVSSHCAQDRQSGWWHGSCTNSNLNGLALEGEFESSKLEGITWYKFRGDKYSLKRVTMKVRPRTGN